MFEGHRAKKAAKTYPSDLARWKQERLIGFQHTDTEGSTTFSVSNRQKPTTIHYGPALSGAFDFRLDLALAHFRATVGNLVRRLQAELAKLDADRPVASAGAKG